MENNDFLLNFNKREREVIKIIREKTLELNIKAYIVGGAVRDIILGEQYKDIDISIESNPMDIIQLLPFVASYEYYEQFSTSKITFCNGVTIDFNMCRKETYNRNGELPIVCPGTIYQDLNRRDFTANALAYDLTEEKIVDFFGGIQDLKHRIIKKVHKNSYEQDPTRILRAVKYSTRYVFFLYDENEIKLLLENNIFNSISRDRFIKEIVLFCKEQNWKHNIIKCFQLGVLHLDEEKLKKPLPFFIKEHSQVYFLKIMSALEKEQLQVFADNKFLNKSENKAIKYLYKEFEVDKQMLKEAEDNYEIYKVMKDKNDLQRTLLSFSDDIKYKVYNFEVNLKTVDKNYLSKELIERYALEGKQIGNVAEYIKKIYLNTKLNLDKDNLITYLF